ncbi:hypothetical protein CALCODRAFT_102986 [Calocera cornea HHB12733]|uniref:Uncharacterized protein n=1 Tax=Calocera cornea HHB12733 TaxID=1353952 RepID=A0A165D5D7_9BASI|nr:hypothetical protein CALCODRAFT_102986 [Calocera cornea HHB12733]
MVGVSGVSGEGTRLARGGSHGSTTQPAPLIHINTAPIPSCRRTCTHIPTSHLSQLQHNTTMSFGDVDSTDLENLFSDMKVTSFVDDLTRPLRWVASGLPSAGKTQRVVVGASYASGEPGSRRTTRQQLISQQMRASDRNRA